MKKKLIIVFAVVAAIVLILFGILFGLLNGGGNSSWQAQYDLGIRYLLEGNYEAAILAFETAISIDPNNPSAYLYAAEACFALGDTERGNAFLENGYQITGDHNIFRLLETIQENTVPESPVSEPASEPTSVTDSSESWDYTITPNGTLKVYDIVDNLRGNYTLQITGASSDNTQVVSVTEADPYVLDLEPGVYQVTIQDNQNPEATESFTLKVDSNSLNKSLSFYTQFEEMDTPDMAQEMTLSKEDRYRINIFLSNFSEQWFHERRAGIFYSDSAAPMDMIFFAWSHAYLNNTIQITYGHPDGFYAGISFSHIQDLVKRFFGRSVTPSDVITDADTFLQDGLLWMPSGGGETHNHMTVVNHMYDLGDGTMEVDFTIYSITDLGRMVDIGGIIQDSSIYYYTPSEAKNHPYMEVHMDGSAIVTPYTRNDGKETYQLIAYQTSSSGTPDPISPQTPEQPVSTQTISLYDGYQKILKQHSETENGYNTEYTLYDINKDGTPELFVNVGFFNFYIYTITASGAVQCGDIFSDYGQSLYAYSGNGYIFHSGGMGYLHLEYLTLHSLTDNKVDDRGQIIISTEDAPYEELLQHLDSLEPIGDFIPITDYSLLEEYDSALSD